MNGSRRISSPDRALRDTFISVAAGLVVGLLVSPLPAISIALVLATIALAVRSLAERVAGRARLAGGVLVGSGAVYLYGAIVTTTACLDDRCGGASPVPLAVFAALVVAAGIVAGALSFRADGCGAATRRRLDSRPARRM